MNYIIFEVKDGDKKKIYEAKIWVKLWMNFKEVQEFKYVGDVFEDGFSSQVNGYYFYLLIDIILYLGMNFWVWMEF